MAARVSSADGTAVTTPFCGAAEGAGAGAGVPAAAAKRMGSGRGGQRGVRAAQGRTTAANKRRDAGQAGHVNAWDMQGDKCRQSHRALGWAPQPGRAPRQALGRVPWTGRAQQRQPAAAHRRSQTRLWPECQRWSCRRCVGKGGRPGGKGQRRAKLKTGQHCARQGCSGVQAAACHPTMRAVWRQETAVQPLADRVKMLQLMSTCQAS